MTDLKGRFRSSRAGRMCSMALKSRVATTLSRLNYHTIRRCKAAGKSYQVSPYGRSCFGVLRDTSILPGRKL